MTNEMHEFVVFCSVVRFEPQQMVDGFDFPHSYIYQTLYKSGMELWDSIPVEIVKSYIAGRVCVKSYWCIFHEKLLFSEWYQRPICGFLALSPLLNWEHNTLAHSLSQTHTHIHSPGQIHERHPQPATVWESSRVPGSDRRIRADCACDSREMQIHVHFKTIQHCSNTKTKQQIHKAWSKLWTLWVFCHAERNSLNSVYKETPL